MLPDSFVATLEEEMTPQRQQPLDEAYWRGTVDQQLKNIAEVLILLNSGTLAHAEESRDWRSKQGDRMNALEEWKNSTTDRLVNIEEALHANPSPNNHNDNTVTWSYIRDKFGTPLLVGCLIFLAFTVGPAVLVMIYFLWPIIAHVMATTPTP